MGPPFSPLESLSDATILVDIEAATIGAILLRWVYKLEIESDAV